MAPTAPVAHADPQGDAVAAIDGAWTAVGGDTSPLGPKDGGIYPAGAGFGQNFAHGAIFFSPATGARSMFGAILEKYRAEGGPDGDLGFPNIDEGTGRVSPDSRNSTFDAADSPVIFWTPATGAWVVRGAINSAWDTLGGSSGPLGVPVEDETYSGESISQRFTGGLLTYDTATRTFTTEPAELAGQLADLQIPDDATSSIDLAWRVAGGPQGQLGAKDGAQYTVGEGGAGQNFAGGKIFFSPETGAHVVSGTILEKYEAAGGPTGELGFPTANEVDGDIPGSRISTFGAPDAPAIVWTPEHGAVVVRGAMKAAWDKLGGSGGDLGVPLADQTGDDTVTQNFSGGQVTWNSANGSFSTQPPELAEQLVGLAVPQHAAPSAPAEAPAAAGDAGSDVDGGGFAWKNSYLWWIVPLAVLLIAAPVGFMLLRGRRGGSRNAGHDYGRDEHHRDYDHDDDDDGAPSGHDDDDRPEDRHWAALGESRAGEPERFGASDADDTAYLDARPGWAERETGARPWSEPLVPVGGVAATSTGADLFTHHGAHAAEDFAADVDDADPDSVDTAPTRVHSEDDENSGRHAAFTGDESRSRWSLDDDAYVPGPNSLFAPVYGAVPPPAPSAVDDAVDESAEDFDDPADAFVEYSQESYIQDTPAQDSHARGSYEQAGYSYAGVAHDEYPRAAPEPESPPPAIHLPLDDPDEAPEGYPIKGSMRTGTYHSPGSATYDVTVAEIWFATEELAESNGFAKAE